MILKKQRNEIFNIVTGFGLNPADFEENNSTNQYILRLRDTPFYFGISDSPNKESPNKLDFIPKNLPGLNIAPVNVKNDRVAVYFSKWTETIKEEIEAPDLWAGAQANALLFESSPSTPDEMFSDIELRQLQGQVRQIEQGIIALRLPAAAQQALLGAINEAPEKATRFTKKEWQGWFIGAVVAQVTNLALSPEHVAAVAQLLKSTFMGLLLR